MTTDYTHPIAPPPELVQQWADQCAFLGDQEVFTNAVQWGADQELDACCEFLYDNELCDPNFHKDFRADRRPKPLSLKKLALAVLENEPEADDMKELVVFDVDQVEIIRRALEQLDD